MTQDFPFAQDSPLSLQGEGWGEGDGLRPHTSANPELRSPSLTLPRKRERGPFGVKRIHEAPCPLIRLVKPIADGVRSYGARIVRHRRAGQRRITANGYTPYALTG